MYFLDNRIQFITIDNEYLKSLFLKDNKIYFRESGYDKKPYVGILLVISGIKYAIPLTSAKEKHKEFKNYYDGQFLIFFNERKIKNLNNAIFIKNEEGTHKHILAVLDVRRMVPIIDGYFEYIDINIKENDSSYTKKYKDLLRKELLFCISIKRKILDVAQIIYDDNSTHAKYNYCNFKKLETIALRYKKRLPRI